MPLYGPFLSIPVPASGQYFYPTGQQSTTTGLFTQNNLRVMPWLVTATLSLSRLAVEVTTAGESGSKFRMGIWADNGNLYPSTLVVDGGVIDGTSQTVQEATISATLSPGVYWIGGAPQLAATTSPTVRCVAATTSLILAVPAGTSLPGTNGTTLGYSVTASAGAFSTFPAGAVTGATQPRLIAKVA